MIDILGRAVHDGDIVVVKGNNYGYENQKPMEIGVAIGESIYTLTSIRKAKDMFLVMNPSKYEIEIKEKILKAREEKLAATKKRAKEKAKNKANKVGTIYLMSRYLEAFLYLGYKTVETYADERLVETVTGNLYISLGTWIRDNKKKQLEKFSVIDLQERDYSTYSGRIPYQFVVLKNHKQYDEILGECIDLPDEIELNYPCKCLINNIPPYKTMTIKISNAK